MSLYDVRMSRWLRRGYSRVGGRRSGTLVLPAITHHDPHCRLLQIRRGSMANATASMLREQASPLCLDFQDGF